MKIGDMALQNRAPHRIEILHVMPGLFCNLSCDHCATSSGPNERLRLTSGEVGDLVEVIKTHLPKKLLFTGGEPTFYLEILNQLISSHPLLLDCEVQVTTNGWFARMGRISKVLGSVVKLDHVQLSYDRYHYPKLAIEDVNAIKDYCVENNIGFNIVSSISDPLDLIFVNEVEEKTKTKVIYNRIQDAGRAKLSGNAFKYPVFESGVLGEKCPNAGMVTYITGRGFSACCSNLVFNSNDEFFIHSSISEHIQSEFYKEIQSKNFGEMILDRGIPVSELTPECSSVCHLCEFIHNRSAVGQGG